MRLYKVVKSSQGRSRGGGRAPFRTMSPIASRATLQTPFFKFSDLLSENPGSTPVTVATGINPLRLFVPSIQTNYRQGSLWFHSTTIWNNLSPTVIAQHLIKILCNCFCCLLFVVYFVCVIEFLVSVYVVVSCLRSFIFVFMFAAGHSCKSAFSC